MPTVHIRLKTAITEMDSFSVAVLTQEDYTTRTGGRS